jgi:hypothetical protein
MHPRIIFFGLLYGIVLVTFFLGIWVPGIWLSYCAPAFAGTTLAYFFPSLIPHLKGLSKTNPLLYFIILGSFVCTFMFHNLPLHESNSLSSYIYRFLVFSYYYFIGCGGDNWPENKKRWESLSAKGKELAQKIALVHNVPKPSLLT